MAQSPVIPKEKLSAYQRWELGSFHEAPPQPEASPADLERVAQLNAHARSEGYRAGHREGLEAGRLEARAEAAPRIAQLDQLLAGLVADLQRVDRELSQEVVQLGLAVARKLVGAALKAHPELVQGCVEEALRQVVQLAGPVQVSVHPDDAALVRAHLDSSPRAATWLLREDASIARGGCCIETSGGEVDATLEHRWQRITTALGDPQGWVA